MSTIGLWMAVTLAAQAPDANALGRRVDLGDATLFIPRAYRPAEDTVDVVLHLHGAPTTVEPALVETGWNAVLIEFNRKGLSRVYTEPFKDERLFARLLDSALQATKTLGLTREPKEGRVVVSSFSAGFGGVREILKVPGNVARIDALVMADSLYCGYEGDPAKKHVDHALMEGFRRFAAEAARGRRTMLLTHSAQIPDGYASTTETADDLIREVGAPVESTRVDWGDGWTQTRRAEKGRFLVLGFSGVEGVDHLKHLRGIAKIWKAIPSP